MVLAQFVGPLSGGHINCAVTFALFIGGRVSFVRLVCYTFSQMAGSVLGAFFLWFEPVILNFQVYTSIT
jgi:aquaporin-5